MKPSAADLWTIDELGAAVALMLSVDYAGPTNGRVRDVPDRRTIRYYTTIGLLDRPAELRGRTALYGKRHLMQLVAIKRLQARGMSLADVQERLYGITNAALVQLAQLPKIELPTNSTDGAQALPDRCADAFWAATPVEVSTAIAAPPENGGSNLNLPYQGIPLDDDVLLLLAPIRPLEEDDLPAIRAAATPLLKLLHTRRLLRPRQERGTP
jgi:hypothetical protein